MFFSDRIAHVRKVASYLLAKILGKFVEEDRRRYWGNEKLGEKQENGVYRSSITATFVEDIVKGFARSKNWRRRQT